MSSDKLSRDEVKKQLEDLIELLQLPAIKPKKVMGKPSIEEDPPDNIKDLLCYIRVSVKYILFDINATRTELAYCKKILKENDLL